MGSAFYTAPEQWVDAKRVDERTDIFSAGKILQALILGSTPVDDLVPRHDLRAVVYKAIEQDPDRRYDSVASLLAAIEGAVAKPDRRWESPEERADRLSERLNGRRSVDLEALAELMEWAEQVDTSDHDAMRQLATTLSVLSDLTIEWWWEQNPAGFRRMFEAYVERLCGEFQFAECDGLANFARRAVNETKDLVILREAIRGLVSLGQYHNRWHVRDVAVSILQSIRSDERDVAAADGLRAADPRGVDWTMGETAISSMPPPASGDWQDP